MKRTTVYLDEKLVKQIRDYSEEAGMLQSEIIRRAIRMYLSVKRKVKS